MTTKKTFYSAALLLAIGLASCTSKSSEQTTASEMETPERMEDNRDVLITLGQMHTSDAVSYNGHSYAYTIDRVPQDSVVVVDADGYRTQDNSITLTILRDGAEFFHRTFTRAAFHIRVPDDYYQQCILLGMNFDRTTDYGLRFVASIGKGADSEDYKPYAVTVGTDGSTNITEHDLYDDADLTRFDDEGV